jgi:DNA repair exonuclease SbcCD ATPase subunit
MKAKVICRALVAAALLAGWSVGPAAAQQDQVQEKDQRLQVLLKQFNEAFKAGRYAEAERLATRAREIDPSSEDAQAALKRAREVMVAVGLVKMTTQREKPTATTPEEVRPRKAVADYTARLNDLSAELAAVEQKRMELKVQLAALDEKAERLRGQMKSLEAERERLLARLKQGQGREATGPGSAPTGDKLDKILQKLDALEKRLADLEKKVKRSSDGRRPLY